MAAIQGDYGKPRPVIVVQANLYSSLPSVTICPVTSTLRNGESFRLDVYPSPENGLKHQSQIFIDKLMTIPRLKVSKVIGHADGDLMLRVTSALATFLAIV